MVIYRHIGVLIGNCESVTYITAINFKKQNLMKDSFNRCNNHLELL